MDEREREKLKEQKRPREGQDRNRVSVLSLHDNLILQHYCLHSLLFVFFSIMYFDVTHCIRIHFHHPVQSWCMIWPSTLYWIFSLSLSGNDEREAALWTLAVVCSKNCCDRWFCMTIFLVRTQNVTIRVCISSHSDSYQNVCIMHILPGLNSTSCQSLENETEMCFVYEMC